MTTCIYNFRLLICQGIGKKTGNKGGNKGSDKKHVDISPVCSRLHSMVQDGFVEEILNEDREVLVDSSSDSTNATNVKQKKKGNKLSSE